MKNKFFFSTLFVALLLSLQSCEIVGGIFKAGTVTGIVIVVAIVALILFIISRAFKK